MTLWMLLSKVYSLELRHMFARDSHWYPSARALKEFSGQAHLHEGKPETELRDRLFKWDSVLVASPGDCYTNGLESWAGLYTAEDRTILVTTVHMRYE